MCLFPLHDLARNARPGATHSSASTCDAFDSDFKESATDFIRRSRVYRIPFPFRAFSLHRITSPTLEDRLWYGCKQAKSLAPRSVEAGYRESGGIDDRRATVRDFTYPYPLGTSAGTQAGEGLHSRRLCRGVSGSAGQMEALSELLERSSFHSGTSSLELVPDRRGHQTLRRNLRQHRTLLARSEISPGRDRGGPEQLARLHVGPGLVFMAQASG